MTPFDGEGGKYESKRKMVDRFAGGVGVYAVCGDRFYRESSCIRRRERWGGFVRLDGKNARRGRNVCVCGRRRIFDGGNGGTCVRKNGERIVFVRRGQSGEPRQTREERRNAGSAERGTVCRSRKYECGRRGDCQRKDEIALFRFSSSRAL